MSVNGQIPRKSSKSSCYIWNSLFSVIGTTIIKYQKLNKHLVISHFASFPIINYLLQEWKKKSNTKMEDFCRFGFNGTRHTNVLWWKHVWHAVLFWDEAITLLSFSSNILLRKYVHSCNFIALYISFSYDHIYTMERKLASGEREKWGKFLATICPFWVLRFSLLWTNFIHSSS